MTELAEKYSRMMAGRYWCHKDSRRQRVTLQKNCRECGKETSCEHRHEPLTTRFCDVEDDEDRPESRGNWSPEERK